MERQLGQATAMDDGSTSGAHGPLQTTLGLASSAAQLVLLPYVTAGKVAYQATSYAVNAPMQITRHVANTLTGRSQPSNEDADDATESTPPVELVDLFGERSPLPPPPGTSSSESPTDLFGENEAHPGDVVLAAMTVEEPEEAAEQPVDASADALSAPGMVSHLLFLPVRLVSSGVSTAVSIPSSVISYSGRKIKGAVSTSHSLASSALVASGGAVARTSRHMANGAISTAAFTATKLTGAVGTSVRTVGYVIPPSVSSAVWQSMGATGNASVALVSYAIAVPAYRMTQAILPGVEALCSEQQAVDMTRDAVHYLVKLLGPQNAFYVLKYIYEAVNSDEAYDMFVLCHDLVRESTDTQNYVRAGAAASESSAAAVRSLAPVVKDIYDMLPSLDEVLDMASLVGDVSNEFVTNVAKAAALPVHNDRVAEEDVEEDDRFEYLDSEDEELPLEEEGGRASISVDVFQSSAAAAEKEPEEEEEELHTEVAPIELEAAFEGPEELPDYGSARSFDSSAASFPDPNELMDLGVSFLSQVCDSEEVASLFTTFGNLLDVLVE